MMHYFQFNIGNYRAATAHLSNEEDLAYRRLLDMYYDTEQKIPLDTQWVARRIRVDTEVVINVLKDMFIEQEDGWFHSKCAELIDQYHAMAVKNKANGRLGGRKKNPVGSQSPPHWQPSAKATINEELETNNNKLKRIHIKTITPPNVSEETWNSFVAQRKLSKATISQTVINSFQREADKAGWTLEQALTETVARGWKGFKADWVKDKPVAQQLKSFKQMDEERSKERYNQMVGRSSSRKTIDITPDNWLEIN
jgi:uncharacterized protein YdaU (DUF1376 family)